MDGTYQALKKYNTQFPWIFGGHSVNNNSVNSVNPVEYSTMYFLSWAISTGVISIICGCIGFITIVMIVILVVIKCKKNKYLYKNIPMKNV